jgi:predicted nucleic acid-binding protein
MVRDDEEIRFVVDTNILISALIRDDSLTSKLLRSNACILFYPWDGLKEIEFYREHIISKRGKHLQEYSFQYALEFVLESVFITDPDTAGPLWPWTAERKRG